MINQLRHALVKRTSRHCLASNEVLMNILDINNVASWASASIIAVIYHAESIYKEVSGWLYMRLHKLHIVHVTCFSAETATLPLQELVSQRIGRCQKKIGCIHSSKKLYLKN